MYPTSYTFHFRKYYAREIGRHGAIPPGLAWFEALERQRQREGWIRAFIDRRLIPDDTYTDFLRAISIYFSYLRDHLAIRPNPNTTIFAPTQSTLQTCAKNTLLGGNGLSKAMLRKHHIKLITYRSRPHRLVPDMALLLDVDVMKCKRYWQIVTDAILPIEYNPGTVIIYIGDYHKRRHLRALWKDYPETYLRLDHNTLAAACSPSRMELSAGHRRPDTGPLRRRKPPGWSRPPGHRPALTRHRLLRPPITERDSAALATLPDGKLSARTPGPLKIAS